MKKFIFKIIILTLLLIVLDYLGGGLLAYTVRHTNKGEFGRHNYISNIMTDDILIMGSSRAYRHYDSKVISDSFNLSCYNCGELGNGIIYNYGIYQLLNRRYHPKIIIFDVMPNFDLLKGEENNKYIKWFKVFYDEHLLSPIINRIDKTETIKMKSKLYRFNSIFLDVIFDYFAKDSHLETKGFDPVDEEMDTLKIDHNKKTYQFSEDYDSLKIIFIKKFVEEVTRNDTKLFFVVSPLWYGMDSTKLEPIKKICEECSIPFWDYANDSNYIHQNQFFYNPTHLNKFGANYFTKELTTKLMSHLHFEKTFSNR